MAEVRKARLSIFSLADWNDPAVAGNLIIGDNGINEVAIGVSGDGKIDIRVADGLTGKKWAELKSSALTLENLAPLLNGVYQHELIAGNNIVINNSNPLHPIISVDVSSIPHNNFGGRDTANAHPQSAITGLGDSLNTLSNAVDTAQDTADAAIPKAAVPVGTSGATTGKRTLLQAITIDALNRDSAVISGWSANVEATGAADIETQVTIPSADGDDVTGHAGLMSADDKATLDKTVTDISGIKMDYLNKNASSANGGTTIDNQPADNGFFVTTTQLDTNTEFTLETNTETGVPTMGGLVAKNAGEAQIGSARLLAVRGNDNLIRFQLRKGKPPPIIGGDISYGDDLLNRADVQTAIDNAVITAGGVGLKIPIPLSLESNLPNISTTDNGTYYVIENMDVTAPGFQGRAWKNQDVSLTAWQKVIDQTHMPDGTWIELDDAGSLSLSANAKSLINGAVQSTQIDTDEPTSSSTDLQITSAKRIWTMFGAALSTLTTTAKTIVGAINELVTSIAGKQDKIAAGTAGNVLTYSGTAGTINSLAVDNTSGGTASSTSLITSGAVRAARGAANGVAPLDNNSKIDAAYLDDVVTDTSSTAKSITLASGKTYNCGTLTSLTITYPSGYFAAEVNFRSGSTPTTLSVPSGTLWYGGEAPEIEANTSYRLTLQFDGIAVKANCGGYAAAA